MSSRWIDLGPFEELAPDAPALRKAEGRRIVIIRRGGEVHALDDRCPHQGYPLSEGQLCGGVLTCAWHNWKFEIATGECTFGGEAVRRYPTRIESGRVMLDLAIDREAEAKRLAAGVRAAVFDADPARALRDGLRLGDALGAAEGALGRVGPALGVLARDGAERAPWGFDHPLALLADLCSWVERGWLGGEEALALAATALGEDHQARPARARPEPVSNATAEGVRADLEAERRAGAEAGVRTLARRDGCEAAHAALLPFVARHVYDYGHGAIFLAKGLELAARFPESAEEIVASVAVQLGWATAETALPPFSATRSALERLVGLDLDAGSGAPAAFDRPRFEEEVLAGERRAVEAAIGALGQGSDARALLLAVAHAAAVRVGRFDRSWEDRLDAEVGVLDVTHLVTFAESALALTEGAPARLAAQLVVLAAGFVGKLRRGDRSAGAEAVATSGPELLEAAAARDLPGALGAMSALDADGRRSAYQKLAPFAALDAAVRPIFVAHAVKMTEALHRLELADPAASDAYLRALVTHVVPVRRERRVRRVAFVARKFLADGRPPEGLY